MRRRHHGSGGQLGLGLGFLVGTTYYTRSYIFKCTAAKQKRDTIHQHLPPQDLCHHFELNEHLKKAADWW
jgi:hypothetical protein